MAKDYRNCYFKQGRGCSHSAQSPPFFGRTATEDSYMYNTFFQAGASPDAVRHDF